MLKPFLIYRPFLDLEVKQDANTMLYNANDMLSAYNTKHNTQKEMKEYFKLKSTEDYIEILNREKSTELEICISKRGKYGWTWMCDKLLVDFMMWLSPEFKSKAIDFILEWASLAGKRHTIKDWYKRLMQAVCETQQTNYKDWATMINVLVMWNPQWWQRARMTEEQMQKVDDMQTTTASLIKAWMDMQQIKNILVKSL